MKNYSLLYFISLSPWPFLLSVNILMIMTSFVKWFLKSESLNLIMSSFFLLILMALWWRDLSRESTLQGYHLSQILTNLKWGMFLFIFSEVLFFLSFFWTFFNNSINPDFSLGMQWPPFDIFLVNPLGVPLLNTLILLSSGVTVTVSHYMMLNNNNLGNNMMLISIILGFYFTVIQLLEYKNLSFSLMDSNFSSIFFVGTGFHGGHVIIGSFFLGFSMLRMKKNQMSSFHHFGLEASIWYWHFVDVVWLFLFSLFYCWGN